MAAAYEAGKRTRTYVASEDLVTGIRENLLLLRLSSMRATVGAEGLLLQLFSMSGCEVEVLDSRMRLTVPALKLVEFELVCDLA